MELIPTLGGSQPAFRLEAFRLREYFGIHVNKV